MRDYGEIPGGKNELKPLLYPFHQILSPLNYGQNLGGGENQSLPSYSKLNHSKKWLTVIDRLGAPGDTIDNCDRYPIDQKLLSQFED